MILSNKGKNMQEKCKLFLLEYQYIRDVQEITWFEEAQWLSFYCSYFHYFPRYFKGVTSINVNNYPDPGRVFVIINF